MSEIQQERNTIGLICLAKMNTCNSGVVIELNNLERISEK